MVSLGRWCGVAALAGMSLVSCRRAARDEADTEGGCGAPPDSAALVRVALDTVARHTGYAQRPGEFARLPGGYFMVHTYPAASEVRDVGGTVRFDCTGRVALVLKDGG